MKKYTRTEIRQMDAKEFYFQEGDVAICVDGDEEQVYSKKELYKYLKKHVGAHEFETVDKSADAEGVFTFVGSSAINKKGEEYYVPNCRIHLNKEDISLNCSSYLAQYKDLYLVSKVYEQNHMGIKNLAISAFKSAVAFAVLTGALTGVLLETVKRDIEMNDLNAEEQFKNRQERNFSPDEYKVNGETYTTAPLVTNKRR